MSAACSAGGDVNNKRRRRRRFGVRRLWLRLKHSDYSPSLSHCIQQTEGMEIKQRANYTFLKIVICLFFFSFIQLLVFFFLLCGAVLQLSGSEVNWPGLTNTRRKTLRTSFLRLTLTNQWESPKSPKCHPPGSSGYLIITSTQRIQLGHFVLFPFVLSGRSQRFGCVC